MKSILEHLPEHKQAEIKSIVSAVIPRFSEIEMIILFGSYATGKWVEDTYTEKGITYEYKSDFDLLFVLSKNTQAENEVFTDKITDVLEGLNLTTPVTPIFHGVDFVNTELSEGNYFFNDIKDEGIVLFTTSRYALAPKRELSASEVQAKAERDFNNWFQSANEFFIDFENAFARDSLNKAAFELHQAAERLYNTIQLVFTGYKAKTHNLHILSKLAASYDLRFCKVFPRATTQEKQRFNLLLKAYTEARYNMDYKISKADLKYLHERVSLLKNLTAEICKEKINSFVSAQ